MFVVGLLLFTVYCLLGQPGGPPSGALKPNETIGITNEAYHLSVGSHSICCSPSWNTFSSDTTTYLLTYTYLSAVEK